MYQSISLKERPDIARIVKAVDPKYRKQKATLHRGATRVTPTGTSWSGGSISHYTHVTKHLATRHVPSPTAPREFGGGEPQPFEIPEGEAVVVTGTFCGKKAYAAVYINDGYEAGDD